MFSITKDVVSMAFPQRKFREIVFQILFCQETEESQEEELCVLLMHELAVTKKTVRTALQRAREIWNQKAGLDDKIAAVSEEYAFGRIQSVEKNVLRLCLYELLNERSVPPKVAVAEAIRLTRKFGSPEGAHFVHAILDAVYQSKQIAV